MLGNDHSRRTAEGRRPEGRRRLEDDLHRVTVELVDPHDVPVLAAGDGGRARVHHVFPVEHHVIGREGLAVVPDDVLLQSPGHGHAVPRDLPVLQAGRLRRKYGNHVTVRIVGRQGFVEDARGVLVLGAVGEVRVQERRRLPPERLDQAATAPFRGIDAPLSLRLRRAGRRQHLRGQGGRQTEPDHRLDEAPAAQAAALHLVDQRPQLTLVHTVLRRESVRVVPGNAWRSSESDYYSKCGRIAERM